MTVQLLAKQAEVSVYVARQYANLFLSISKERRQYTIKEGNDLLYVLDKWLPGKDVVNELGICRQWLHRLRTEYNMPCREFSEKVIYYEIEIVKKYVKRLKN